MATIPKIKIDNHIIDTVNIIINRYSSVLPFVLIDKDIIRLKKLVDVNRTTKGYSKNEVIWIYTGIAQLMLFIKQDAIGMNDVVKPIMDTLK